MPPSLDATTPPGQAELALRLRSPWVLRFLILLLMGITVLLSGISPRSPLDPALLTICAAAVLLVAAYQLDYLNPAVAYALPWVLILVMSMLPISEHAQQLHRGTYAMILAALFIWLAATIRSPVESWRSRTKQDAQARPMDRVATGNLSICIVILIVLAAVDVAYSGFLPVWSLVTTGDSHYQDFGIPSIHGLLAAYANALGCLSIYLYYRTRERRYLLYFLGILALHLSFVTRGFFLILLVEAFVIRSITVARIPRKAMVIVALLGLYAFSRIGTLRSGNIKEIIGVLPEYYWIPDGAVWFYAYSYFSVLNLENMMQVSDAPYFAGIMLRRLLPSVLRPESDIEVDYALPAMNVLSYMYPMYMDLGLIGVAAITGVLGLLTSWVYRLALVGRKFTHVAAYACLFFCAAFSFFIDFWFYLPVISQIPFFFLLQRIAFIRTPRPQRLPL